jgi:phosphatidate cytidylyltransferase
MKLMMTEELRSRWIYALIVGSIVSLFILLLGANSVFLLSMVGGLLAWREYARLVRLQHKASFYLWGYGWVMFAFTFAYVNGPQSTTFWFWLAPFSTFAILAAERLLLTLGVKGVFEESPEEAWRLIKDFSFGCLYVFFLFGFVGPIVRKPSGQELLFMTIATVVFADTAAYFGGKKYGKRKLWSSLSPGKTLEGAYFALAGAFLGAFLIHAFFLLFGSSKISWIHPFIVGLLVAPLAILGDLMESLIKRVAGAKDSGTLLPGHGGLLDRMDAYVFVFPVIYFGF